MPDLGIEARDGIQIGLNGALKYEEGLGHTRVGMFGILDRNGSRPASITWVVLRQQTEPPIKP
ncbi:MAG: hypothetical protein ACREVJ_03305 [Gammaproteobacteria bacterium]